MPSCFFRRLLCFLLLLIATLAQGADRPEPVQLSMKTAMAMAIRNNLDLRGDALDSSIAETYLKQSQGLYDPYLSLTGNRGQTFYTGETYGVNNTTTSFGLTQNLPTGGSLTASTQTGYSTPESDIPDDNWTDWYTSVGLSLYQPLLKNFGKESTELNISLAENRHINSLEQFRLSITNTVYSVIREYNHLYTLRQVLESREKSLRSAQQMLDSLNKKGKQRDFQTLEIANTEYAISQRLKDLVDAERLIKDQEARLRYLVGMESKLTLVPIDPPSRVEPMETIDQAISLAMEERSDLKQLRLDLESSELQERVAKGNLLPNLAVTAGGGFRGIEDTFSDSVNQIGDGKGRWWSAGLQLSIPLGNSAAESDYRRNSLQTTQKRYELASFKWKLRDYIEADMRALVSARVQIQVADRALRTAELRVEKYRKSVIGKSSQIQDLINAENDLVFARDDQTRAFENFANGVALLWKDAGVLLERMEINVDTREPEKVISGAELRMERVLTNTTPFKPLEQPPLTTAPSAPVIKTAEYTLKISGDYIAAELAQITEKVVAAGLVPLVTSGHKQPRTLIRLKAGDFESFQVAQTEREKLLLKVKEGPFILKDDKGHYTLYAGSYLHRSNAEQVQKQLAASGLKLTLEESTVMLPTSQLTAGRFPSREDAVTEALKLEKLGIKSVVQKNN